MLRDNAIFIVVAGAAIAACGGGGPEVQAGVGNGSLRVEASVSASPVAGERAADAQGLRVEFAVDVFDAKGDPVPDAEVVFDSVLGPVTLGGGDCTRRYCGVQAGYAGSYGLSVARGGDFLDDVVFYGPAVHTVQAPVAGAEVDAGEPLAVRWAPAGAAERSHVESREFGEDLDGDPGAFELPPEILRFRDDRPEDERVRVRREQSLDLTGGLPGSELTISVRNGVEITTAPRP